MTGRRGASFFSLNTGRATLISSDVGKTKTGGRVIYVTWTTKQKDAFFLKRCSLFKPQQKSGRDMCELRNRPRSLWSLCGSVIRASKRGIRIRIFSLSHARDKAEKNIFLFFFHLSLRNVM